MTTQPNDVDPDVTRRLPDGAQYFATWDASNKRWQVQLIIQARHDALAQNGRMVYAMNGASLFGVAAIVAGQYEDEQRTIERRAKRARRKR